MRACVYACLCAWERATACAKRHVLVKYCDINAEYGNFFERFRMEYNRQELSFTTAATITRGQMVL